MNYNCFNLLDTGNLQEQVKKAFCYQKLFWPFTVRTNCSSDLKFFANSWPSVLNFKSFSLITRTIFSHSRSEQFGNKIPFNQELFLTLSIPEITLKIVHEVVSKLVSGTAHKIVQESPQKCPNVRKIVHKIVQNIIQITCPQNYPTKCPKMFPVCNLNELLLSMKNVSVFVIL